MQMKQLALHLTLALVMTLTLTLTASANGPQSLPTWTPPPPTDQSLVDQLEQVTEGKMHISYHAGTGKVRFISTDPERPIPRLGTLPADIQPEQAARAFLGSYGQLFGLTDQAKELAVMRARVADNGRSIVRFQQAYKGVPVLGGELIVRMDSGKNVMSANGEVSPDLQVNTVPTISKEQARQQALETVAKNYQYSVETLTTTEPELWIYDPALIGAPGPRITSLGWRIQVQPVELLPFRELVLVDAQHGFIVLHFNQVDTSLYRRVYDNQNNSGYGLPGNGPVRIEGQGATGIHDVDWVYDFIGDVYDYYSRYHGRGGVDGAGSQIVATVRYCPNSSCSSSSPWNNAMWSNGQLVFGGNYLGDDVVAHEMTHGVTDYESQLFYYMQSGAINEAFSDIWGEFVDLTHNTHGDDSASARWLHGEDLPNGYNRNMKDPPNKGDPDRMTSYYYACGTSDNGGVHTNSGVGNKAAYLITDGGTFNGYTVAGIGITKTAKVFYEAQTELLTSGSDYNDLYDALQQACTDLIDQAASTTAQAVISSDSIRYTSAYTVYLPMIMRKYRQTGITVADCQQVKKALDATEMSQQPSYCAATHAPVCSTGYVNNDLFFDNMENTSSGKWTMGTMIGPNTWHYPDSTYATSSLYSIWGNDQSSRSDSYIRMTSDVALPSGSQPYLHFNHAYYFEVYQSRKCDGGVLEYSTNGGASWNDAGSLFSVNGYDDSITTYYDNPLAGRSAFVDISSGYISSRLDLSSLAGQMVRFRYRIGTDTDGSRYGWFIDDVRIYTCVLPPPPAAPVLNSISNSDNDGDYGVTWSAVSGATSYTLQEDDNAGFSSPTTQYAGSATSWSASNHVTGTYYYRAQASNLGGTSGWSNIQSVTITVGPPSWTTINTEDFEGSFPGTTWIVYDDDGLTNGEYYWAKRNCRPYAGSYSGWAVGGGANGALLGCGVSYPNNADSIMVYGPFGLTSATAADLSFKLWLNSESDWDFVCRGASINGVNFYGICTSGATGDWIDRVLDLSNVPTLGNLMGQPNVWIMLEFYSDSMANYAEGGYVDDIVLRKCTAPACAGMGSTVSYSGNGRVVEFPRMITLPR